MSDPKPMLAGWTDFAEACWQEAWTAVLTRLDALQPVGVRSMRPVRAGDVAQLRRRLLDSGVGWDHVFVPASAIVETIPTFGEVAHDAAVELAAQLAALSGWRVAPAIAVIGSEDIGTLEHEHAADRVWTVFVAVERLKCGAFVWLDEMGTVHANSCPHAVDGRGVDQDQTIAEAISYGRRMVTVGA